MIDIESIRKRHEAATPGPYIADLDVFDPEGAEIEACVSSPDCSILFTSGCGVANVGTDEDRAAAWAKARASQGLRDAEFLAGTHDDVADLLAENARLTAALTTAKDEERAAVVAWLRGEAQFTDVGPLDTFADAYATAIEAGRHREKA